MPSARLLIVRRVSYSLFLILAAFLFFAFPAHAQYNQEPQQQANPYIVPNTNPDVPKNLSTYTQSAFIEILGTFTCHLGGVNAAHPGEKCLGIDPDTGNIGYVENGTGMIGMMGTMIAVMYTPPFHTSDYTRYLAQNFGIAKPVIAQEESLGFQGIAPLAGLWLRFRDIVFLIFILVFILMGMGIMLRLHIDPRTVMTIQNQIPKVIIGLLLVTFSFPIAGLLVDFMYVFTYVSANVIANASPHTSDGTNNKGIDLTTLNSQIYTPPIGFVNEMFPGEPPQNGEPAKPGGLIKISKDSSGGIKDIIQSLIGLTAPTEKSFVVPFFSGVGDIFTGDWAKNVLANFLGWLGAVLAFFIILVALLFALFRLWFMLLKAYIFFLLDVVLAPFWILGGIIPGSPMSVGAWFRDMIAHLSTFPVTIIMILLGKVFMDSFLTYQTTPLFTPPLIGNPNLGAGFGSIIAMGIIFITPKVAEMTQEMFKSPQFKYTAAIGEALGVGQKATGEFGGSIKGRLWKVSSTGEAQGVINSRIASSGNRFIKGLSRLAGRGVVGGGGGYTRPPTP